MTRVNTSHKLQALVKLTGGILESFTALTHLLLLTLISVLAAARHESQFNRTLPQLYYLVVIVLRTTECRMHARRAMDHLEKSVYRVRVYHTRHHTYRRHLLARV